MKRKASKIAKKNDGGKKIIIPDPLKACIQKVYDRYGKTSTLPKLKWNTGTETFDWGIPGANDWFDRRYSILGSISQGTASNERIGSNITNQFLYLQLNIQQVSIQWIQNTPPTPDDYTIERSADVIPSGVKWKIAVVIDRQPKADAIAVYGDIYDYNFPNNTCILRDMDNIDRFDEIWSQEFILNNIWAPAKTLEADIPLHYLKSTYGNGLGAQVWPTTNDILITISAVSTYRGFDDALDLNWPDDTYLWEAVTSLAWRIYYTDG